MLDVESIIASLRSYVVEEVLEGRDVGLETTSPLLEWGILNSMELAKIVRHIKENFGVHVPDEQIVAENFKDLQSIGSLVLTL